MIIFKLTKSKEMGYKNREEWVEKYFKNNLSSRDKNFFCIGKKLNQNRFNMCKIAYFLFEGELIGQAKFTGEIHLNYKKVERKYKNGYEIKDVTIFEHPISINLEDIGKSNNMRSSFIYVERPVDKRFVKNLVDKEINDIMDF